MKIHWWTLWSRWRDGIQLKILLSFMKYFILHKKLNNLLYQWLIIAMKNCFGFLNPFNRFDINLNNSLRSSSNILQSRVRNSNRLPLKQNWDWRVNFLVFVNVIFYSNWIIYIKINFKRIFCFIIGNENKFIGFSKFYFLTSRGKMIKVN